MIQIPLWAIILLSVLVLVLVLAIAGPIWVVILLSVMRWLVILGPIAWSLWLIWRRATKLKNIHKMQQKTGGRSGLAREVDQHMKQYREAIDQGKEAEAAQNANLAAEKMVQLGMHDRALGMQALAESAIGNHVQAAGIREMQLHRLDSSEPGKRAIALSQKASSLRLAGFYTPAYAAATEAVDTFARARTAESAGPEERLNLRQSAQLAAHLCKFEDAHRYVGQMKGFAHTPKERDDALRCETFVLSYEGRLRDALRVQEEIGDSERSSLLHEGSTYENLGEFQKAAECYQRALAQAAQKTGRNVKKNMALCRVALAQVRMELKNYAEAKTLLQEAQGVYEPDSLIEQRIQIILLRIDAITDSLPLPEIHEKASMLLTEVEATMRVIPEARDARHRRWEDLGYLSDIFYETGEAEKALTILEPFVESEMIPVALPHLLVRRARCYEALGRHEEARQSYTLAANSKPGEDYWANVAREHLKDGH